MKKILTEADLKKLNSKKGLLALLSKGPINTDRALRYVDYEKKTGQATNRIDSITDLGHRKKMNESLFCSKEEMQQGKGAQFEELPKELTQGICELLHCQSQQ